MDFSKPAIFISTVLALTGCGNKGPLYLPVPEKTKSPPPVESPETGFRSPTMPIR
ncbi:MAG TPA: lipoprotein [Gammaproteobacteria bacterium]